MNLPFLRSSEEHLISGAKVLSEANANVLVSCSPRFPAISSFAHRFKQSKSLSSGRVLVQSGSKQPRSSTLREKQVWWPGAVGAEA